MTENVSLLTAFIAGILSFLSPCILPLIPPYFSWVLGISRKDLGKKKTRAILLMNGFFVIFGFSVLFIILGASATRLGWFLNLYRLPIQKIGGVILLLFGLELMGFLRVFKKKKVILLEKMSKKIGKKTSSFLIGLIFASAWVACFSPILGSILVLSSFQKTVDSGVLLLIFYSVGLAIPFLLSLMFITFVMEKISFFSKLIVNYLNPMTGLILFVFGILLITDKLYKLVSWLSNV